MRSVTGLPHVGTLYVRLMTYAGGGWQYNDYTYTMSVPAMMSSPAPGSTLPGPGVMFQWNGHASIGNYWLYVGTGGAGSGNILSTGVTNTWRYVGGLPASGTGQCAADELDGKFLALPGLHLQWRHGATWLPTRPARTNSRRCCSQSRRTSSPTAD